MSYHEEDSFSDYLTMCRDMGLPEATHYWEHSPIFSLFGDSPASERFVCDVCGAVAYSDYDFFSGEAYSEIVRLGDGTCEDLESYDYDDYDYDVLDFGAGYYH